MKKAFRTITALSMLIIYLSAMIGTDIVDLSCQCRHHHDTECTSVGCDHHHDDCRCDCCSGNSAELAFTTHRCCDHDHSNFIELYTQPRSGDDDASIRNAAIHFLQAYISVDAERINLTSTNYTYGEYLTLSDQSAEYSVRSLRAPPVFA